MFYTKGMPAAEPMLFICVVLVPPLANVVDFLEMRLLDGAVFVELHICCHYFMRAHDSRRI